MKEESSEQPLLGELTVTGVTPDSLHLSWTVAQGPFDSFVIQYKDAQGQPQTVPVAGDENEVTVPGLESNRKYKMNLYGLRGRQRVGPVSVVAKTGESEPTLLAPGPRQGCPPPTPPSISAVLLLRPLPPSSQPLFCPCVHPGTPCPGSGSSHCFPSSLSPFRTARPSPSGPSTSARVCSCFSWTPSVLTQSLAITAGLLPSAPAP